MALQSSPARQPELSTFDLVSTDLFDTVLLRDLSSEQTRFDEAARLAAERFGLDPRHLSALRCAFHGIAYKSVAAGRPRGDASLETIWRVVAEAAGRPGDAPAMRALEVATDIRHLSPNHRLLAHYEQLAAAGKRIIAITDTYYSTGEIHRILDQVVGPHPIAAIYASCDVGLTKHAGGLFAEVASREGVLPARILHFGDDPVADVRQARAAGVVPVHLPRPVMWRRVSKAAIGVRLAAGRARTA